MNTIGSIFTFLSTVTAWVFGKDNFLAWKRRRELSNLRKDIIYALDRNDFDTVHRLFDELRELASKP